MGTTFCGVKMTAKVIDFDWFKRNLLSNFIGLKGPLKKGHIAYNWINDNAYYIKMI